MTSCRRKRMSVRVIAHEQRYSLVGSEISRITDNHSIAYCLLGYLCAYYRYYYPVEFITAFLNNAANDDDIKNGTQLAKLYKINITSPKYGISGGDYSFDKESRTIAKGLSSIKHIGTKLAAPLLELSKSNTYDTFTDLLCDMRSKVGVDSAQLDILINIDFFSQFGNQRELETIVMFWRMFKMGGAKQIRKDKIKGSYIDEVVRKYGDSSTKSGKEAVNYKISDAVEVIRECERKALSLNLPDYGILTKARKYHDAMGYAGYISNKEEDRSTLIVNEIYPLKRKSDGKQFGYSITAQSIGSGIENRFSIFNSVYEADPIDVGDIIRVISWTREKGQYFTIRAYKHLKTDFDLMDELEE